MNYNENINTNQFLDGILSNNINVKNAIKFIIYNNILFGHSKKLRHFTSTKHILYNNNYIDIYDPIHVINSILNTYNNLVPIFKDFKNILFVNNTKNMCHNIITNTINMYISKYNGIYYIKKWIGGILTNKVLQYKIEKLNKIKNTLDNYHKNKYSKLIKYQYNKISNDIESIRNMNGLPNLIILFNVKENTTAILEARKINIPILALIDTDGNSENIQYQIFGNDDNISSIMIYMQIIDKLMTNRAKNEV